MCTQPSRRHLLRWCVCAEHTNRHVLKSQNTHVIKSHYRRWLIELRGGVDKVSRINKRGVWNKVRVGWQIPQKLINGRARLFDIIEKYKFYGMDLSSIFCELETMITVYCLVKLLFHTFDEIFYTHFITFWHHLFANGYFFFIAALYME